MSEEIPKEESPKEEKTSAGNELNSLKEALTECQDKYLRTLAESENARKRMQKEKQESIKYAIESMLVEFLHPIDNFEKALKFAESMSGDVKTWAIGFEMILSQFKQALLNHGVEEYHSVGKPFDAHFHEAVEMVETKDYAPGTVVEEDSRGYKMGDRPIRVARVKVAKAKENKEIKEEKKQ